MAAGRAIVATDVGANGILVRHEREGLIVPPRDDRALAAAFGGYSTTRFGRPARGCGAGAGGERVRSGDHGPAVRGLLPVAPNEPARGLTAGRACARRRTVSFAGRHRAGWSKSQSDASRLKAPPGRRGSASARRSCSPDRPPAWDRRPGRSRSESTICPPFSTPFFTSSVILVGLMSTVTDCLPCGVGTLEIWYQPRYQPRPRNATVAAPTRARMFAWSAPSPTGGSSRPGRAANSYTAGGPGGPVGPE